MYMQVLILCLFAHFKYCHCAQPGLKGSPQQSSSLILKRNLNESHSLNHKSNILSLITDAGNCTAYGVLKSKLPTYSNYVSHCDRPVGALPDRNEYIEYGLCLCMVLYEVVRGVCKMKDQDDKLINEVFDFKENLTSDVCDEMNKTLSELHSEVEGKWISFLKVNFENITNCERACLQGNVTNPLCVYILKGNTLAMASKKDMSSGGSRISQQLSSQDPGKGNETSISNAKVLQEETGKPASEADPQLVKPKLKYEKTIPSSNKTLVTDKPPASAARPQLAKPKHKHENPIPSTNETGVTDKPPASPTDPQVVNSKNEHEHIIPSSNKTSVTDKLTDNSNVHNHSETNANITKSNSTVDMEASHTKQNHAKGKNHSDAVTGLSTSSHNRSVKLVTGVEKHEGSLEEVTNQKSEITAVPVSENKASAVETPSKEVQNKNDDEHALPTEKKYNKSQNTDSAYNVPNDDDHEESEDIVNIDTPGEQSEQDEPTEQAEEAEQDEQIQKESKKHQEEEAATGNDNTAKFNQLGDSEDSHFYAYFMTMVVVCIIGYLVFHNKQKILALALEGRSRRGTRRRPSTSAYRKLDSNIEEAVTSTCSTSVTHVIY